MKKKSLLKKMLKLIAYIFAAIIAIIILLALYLYITTTIVHNYRNQVELNKDFNKYLVVDRNIHKVDNAQIAIIGLSAPENVQDTYQWGLDLLQEKQKKFANKASFTKESMIINSINEPYDMLYINAGLPATKEELSAMTIEQQVRAMPNSMKLKGESKEDTKMHYCLIWGIDFGNHNNNNNNNNNNDKCATNKQVLDMADANRLLLERYMKLTNYSSFKNLPVGDFNEHGDTGLFIDLTKLTVANLVVQSRLGKSDAAIDNWLKLNSFFRRALADENTLMDKSTLMMSYPVVIKSLPNILSNSPELAKKHELQLANALSPFGADKYNLAGAVKAEYSFSIGFLIDKLGNYYGNKSVEFAKDFSQLSKESALNFDAKDLEFRDKWIEKIDLVDPIYGTFYNFIISGVSFGSSLMHSMHEQNATARMLNLQVNILANKVSYNDMPNYIQNLPSEFNNPLTEKPYEWDAEKKSIYFDLEPYGNPPQIPRLSIIIPRF
jgi:hypothetical protein